MGIVLIISAVLLVINEIAVYKVYGAFVNRKANEVFLNLKNEDYWLNSLDTTIICFENRRGYITNIPFSIFSKYHIYGFGTVPRWSKLHKKINEYYLTAEIK